MAKKRYRKYYRRSRGRWAANIKNVNKQASLTFSTAEMAAGGTLWMSDLLAENPAQADNSVSQIYTVKNFDFSFYIENDTAYNSVLDNFSCYIVYIPQGFELTNDVIRTHPEWIMAMRYIGQSKQDSQEQQYLPFRIKTRMARKLNTGDQIHFLVVGTRDPATYSSAVTIKLDVKGLVRWWTKAN